MNGLVSIVLPLFNGEKFLRESIESVIAQTYTNWELLILDDCSQDASPDIAKEYELKDSRIRYYCNDHNLQLPGNLNRGFSLAIGDYLTWTSDDNRYHPEAIERMINALNADPEAGFVFASCRIIDSAGKGIEYIMVSPDSVKWIVGKNTVGACFLYTRSVYEQVGNYDCHLKYVEDFDYWQRICIRFKAIGIEEILYDYRLHDGTLTSTLKKEEYNRHLEKALLKNRSGFGRISVHQNYLYAKSLYNCRKETSHNPYRWFYLIMKFTNLIIYRIPRKIHIKLQR